MSDSEEIINFTFLYDDKKTPLYELEDKIVNNLKDLTDIDKIKLFYLNHLDLFIKNQNKFKNVIRNQYFLDKYIKTDSIMVFCLSVAIKAFIQERLILLIINSNMCSSIGLIDKAAISLYFVHKTHRLMSSGKAIRSEFFSFAVFGLSCRASR